MVFHHHVHLQSTISMILLISVATTTSCAWAFSTNFISNMVCTKKKRFATPIFQLSPPSSRCFTSAMQPLSMAVSAPSAPSVSSSSALSEEAIKTSSSSVSPYNWSSIDSVYLITCPNGDPDSKRITRAKQILSDVGLIDKVTVKEFETDDEDRIRGCYTSHLSVMRDHFHSAATANGRSSNQHKNAHETKEEWWQGFFPFLNGNNVDVQTEVVSETNKNILVLEDNIEVTGNLDQSVLDAISVFIEQKEESWNMILLSYIPYVPNLQVSKTSNNKSLVKLSCGIGSALGTTAYIINESSMKRIIQQDNERGFYAPIPDLMAELFPSSRYAAYPTPFLRAPKMASLVNPQLDDLRELLFQPPLVSAVQSILATTGLSTNALLPITVVALLVVASLAGKTSLDAAVELVSTGSYEGNVLIPFISSVFSVFSLGILAQGAALAPKPPPEQLEGPADVES
uniref:Uncharacterized protein n=1 Tax=Ditylum brightwellii TaxID=49249 RepID=A0A6V2MJ68_9STRA|mmetsp:Transcript_8644/g.12733  ORF Transcript_8644/g.12733 Transcript_8644/m.12733 type:complete len:457 (+) Transcript_8644:175-1545(+)